MPANFFWDKMSEKYMCNVQNRLFFRTVEVRNTPFLWKILIVDHKFLYNICSTRQDLQNELSLEYLAQSWFFNVLAAVTLTSMVTLTFDPRSWNIVYMLSGYDTHLPTKYEVNPSIGLGGVWGQTHRHTHTDTHTQRTLRYYNIDFEICLWMWVRRRIWKYTKFC